VFVVVSPATISLILPPRELPPSADSASDTNHSSSSSIIIIAIFLDIPDRRHHDNNCGNTNLTARNPRRIVKQPMENRSTRNTNRLTAPPSTPDSTSTHIHHTDDARRPYYYG
jgi:hypothetical protein